ncbi:hypothetical protein BV25DRAFT_1894095 [Artomyces pyxidatus]|uniref:Uncharacterized protein n=1 Tax=Artomyces pyxidatus TaxID=48021 RepID=A0ACB8SIW5_9AGAM|nr:hypothetical protein BV25DRAFT_1894095 [Artomyces pyxidatus]
MAFLHRHCIVHTDIREDNILTNQFGSENFRTTTSKLRDALHRQDLMTHAIIDFDLARMLPPGTDYLDAAELRHWCPLNQPTRSAGELQYDPFVRNVGTLGGMFCSKFQAFTKDVPLMAPCLDRMVTIDTQQRFTAAEELDFLQNVRRPSLTYQLFHAQAVRPIGRWTHDRWQGLPPEFVEKRAAYRAPKPSAKTVFLRRVCKSQAGSHVDRMARRAVRLVRTQLGRFSSGPAYVSPLAP